MIDYRRELNDEQYDVVMEPGGPLLVIAGAGSGKTRTLTYRVTRLIDEGQDPGRILLATFTNKAARSMVGRVQSLLMREVPRLWGGTFHHIAHRILRTNAERVGYNRRFSIIDAEDARQLMNTCLADRKIPSSTNDFPKGNVLTDILSLSVNTEESLESVISGRYPFFICRLGEIEGVLTHYRERKKALNLMDFDDLLFFCRHVLRDHADVLERYSGRFLHVLVDEYQDTNKIQAEIIDLLASGHRNLMVVGDDSQSIYSFRGANFENILRFPDKYPDCRLFKLETNYRSTPEILHLANLCIVQNRRQFHKELRSIRGGGIKPVVVPTRNVYQQAEFVAQRILELSGDGVPLSEIAVLYRAHYHSMELQMELTRRRIPFEIRSGIRFFEQAHVKDVVSYLRIMDNPKDELAWRRILGLYPRIGKATIEKIWKFLAVEASPLQAIMEDAFLKQIPKGAVPGIEKCREIFHRMDDGSEPPDPREAVEHVLQHGYGDYIRGKYSDWSSREDDLVQLAVYASKFTDLDAMLSELALMSNTGEQEGSEIEDVPSDRVILTSIHQAKGLEWSAVFVLWCCEGMIPLARALNEPDGEEEERRLFYVAVTRAKDRLHLCCPLYDPNRGMGYLPLSPSRFIRELSSVTQCNRENPFDQWLIEEVYQ
ncbi:MAG: ATP-dependent helicase [Deltaproteobacteria bacterium]|nr:ATP-dependent helicase [Deltaproteobacteria bacterium]